MTKVQVQYNSKERITFKKDLKVLGKYKGLKGKTKSKC